MRQASLQYPIIQEKWHPTRESALAALDDFLPRVPAYARERNFDRPGQQGISGLSPFLRYRILHERELIQKVLARHPHQEVGKFVEEVCWRTYWKGYLELRPELWIRYREELQSSLEGLSGDLLDVYQAVLSGRSGLKCLDAWTEELISTNWLHNHARMWFASIWIFTMKLPWQLGAAFFLKHLLDGDPASNTLSWRWVAGLHTRGKPYLARADNIRRFTEGRFFPEGQLDESAPSLPDDGTFPARGLPVADEWREFPFPSLSDCPVGLLVTPEDLTPETGELSETPLSSIAVFSAHDILDSYDASAPVRAFISGAVADASSRLAGHWGGRVVTTGRAVESRLSKASPEHVGLREPMRVYSGTVDTWVDGVLTWAANENLKSVWLLRPPVGPWAEAFPLLKRALHHRGIRLFNYRRRWDALHWPHCTGGFFPFRKGLTERNRLLIS